MFRLTEGERAGCQKRRLFFGSKGGGKRVLLEMKAEMPSGRHASCLSMTPERGTRRTFARKKLRRGGTPKKRKCNILETPAASAVN